MIGPDYSRPLLIRIAGSGETCTRYDSTIILLPCGVHDLAHDAGVGCCTPVQVLHSSV